MTVASLDHLNLTVNDFKQSAQWYADIFGFRIVEQGKMPDGRPWGVLRNGDSMLCIYEDTNRQPIPEHDKDYDKFHRIYHFSLRISDRETWEKTIKDHNLKIHYNGPIPYPNSFSWYVDDPSGHEIEVVLWKNNVVKFS